MKRQEAIEDQALNWLIRRNSPDWTLDEQVELGGWLDESMAHKAAFWRADHLWRQADRIRSLGIEPDDRMDRRQPVHRWWSLPIAASLIAAIGFGGSSLAPSLFDRSKTRIQETRFGTPVGATRVVPMADGSTVELNTRTVIRTGTDRSKREVWLDGGEAFFEVNHREGDPFLVHAGRQTVTVLGTKFSVRRDKDRVTVNVLEGRVRVDDGKGSAGHAAIITAGDTAISRGESTLIAAKSERRVENALAWRGGMLRFEQAPLSDVVAEFNRYNRVQFVVADAEAGRIPIGGFFQASGVDSFMRLLRDAYKLNIRRNKDIVTISSG